MSNPEAEDRNRLSDARLVRCWHAVAAWVSFGLTAIAMAIDALIKPILDPFMLWLSGQSSIRAMERAIADLPVWLIAILIIVPLLAQQGARILALFMIGSGMLVTGALVYVGARIFSVLVSERVFAAGEKKLMSIEWFAKGHDWFEHRRRRRVETFKTTRTYAWAVDQEHKLARWFHRSDGG